MVAVALQVEQREVGDEVVGVPRVVRLRCLVGTARQPLAQQPVVLHVVGRGELPPGDHVVDEEEGQHHRAERGDQSQLQQRGERVALQHRVVRAECAATLAREALAFELPAAADAARELAQRESVDALAQARARVVLGRGDVAMVATAVLDGEVPVGRHREQETREDLLDGSALVPELVRGGQPHARVDACHVGDQRHAPPGQRLRARPPRADEEHREVDRHRRPGEPAIVAIRFELRHDFLRRVAPVLADQRIEQRHQPVADGQRQREPGRLPGGGMCADPQQRNEGVHHGERPGPALAVAVLDPLAVRADGDVEHGADYKEQLRKPQNMSSRSGR